MPMLCVDENFMKEYLLNERVTADENAYLKDRCIKTGFKEIDERYGGLMRGETYLVVGRPSMGRTSFAFNIWANLLKDKENFYRTAVFSLEMSREQAVKHLARIMGADFNGKVFNLSEKNKKILEEIASGFSCIDDTSGPSMEEIYRSCKTVEGDIDLIIIDYAQLIRTEKGWSSFLNLGETLENAKRIAMEFNCALILIGDFPKNVDNRIDHRPTLDDLLRVGVPIDKADHIWAIYRDDFYYKESEEHGLAEIIALKPMAEVKTFKLAWLPEHCRFANISNG